MSGVRGTDTALVIAESAIDALSYAALHPDENARYASFGGAMNPDQPALIRGAIRRLPACGAVWIATDNDDEGTRLARKIAEFLAHGGRDDLAVHRVEPDGAKDWNETLLSVRQTGQVVG